MPAPKFELIKERMIFIVS